MPQARPASHSISSRMTEDYVALCHSLLKQASISMREWSCQCHGLFWKKSSMDGGLMAILRRASETVGPPDPAATTAMLFDCEVRERRR